MVKTVILLITSVALLYAGSVSMVSNRFSLNNAAGIIGKQNVFQRKSGTALKTVKLNHGIIFELQSSGSVFSLSIIDIKGSIVRTIRTVGKKSIFWNGCNSYGARLAAGCYLARVNNQFTQAIVLPEKDFGK